MAVWKSLKIRSTRTEPSYKKELIEGDRDPIDAAALLREDAGENTVAKSMID